MCRSSFTLSPAQPRSSWTTPPHNYLCMESPPHTPLPTSAGNSQPTTLGLLLPCPPDGSPLTITAPQRLPPPSSSLLPAPKPRSSLVRPACPLFPLPLSWRYTSASTSSPSVPTVSSSPITH